MAKAVSVPQIEQLKTLIQKDIRHQDYDRTVDIAKFNRQIITGDEIDQLMRVFELRETADAFQQRKDITIHVTDSICNGIKETFRKVFRVKPSIRAIDFNIETKNQKDKENVTKKIQSLESELLDFFPNGGLETYLKDTYMDMMFIDPNSFIVFELNEEKKTIPFQVYSDAAVDYKYVNGVLDYLVVKTVLIGDYADKKNEKYTMYLKQHAIVLQDIPKYQTPGVDEIEVTKGRFMTLLVSEHKVGYVPAIRTGYAKDAFTNGRSMVSPLEPARAWFLKVIKTVSELDLSITLHTFVQKIQYVEPCVTGPTGICVTSNSNPAECQKCGKQGFISHKSTQDTIIVKKPRSKEEMYDLDDLIVYKDLPIDIVKFLADYSEFVCNKVHKSIFNSEIFTKDEVANTATGKNIDMQNVYDTMQPFAEKVSIIWCFGTKTIATHSSIDSGSKIILRHQYPVDFKMKGLTELLADLKSVSDSNASGYVRQAIMADILKIMYADNVYEYQKMLSKQNHFPFNGKTESEIQSIIASNLAPKSAIVLWANFDSIFDTVEEVQLQEQNRWFYDLTFIEQKAIISDTVKKLVEEIDEEANTALSLSEFSAKEEVKV